MNASKSELKESRQISRKRNRSSRQSRATKKFASAVESIAALIELQHAAERTEGLIESRKLSEREREGKKKTTKSQREKRVDVGREVTCTCVLHSRGKSAAEERS